jgi:hypothetical protein
MESNHIKQGGNHLDKTTYELVTPEGMIGLKPLKMNPHPADLSGKTVVLRWNGKHNGDNYLGRIAELLAEKVPGIKIIKTWESAIETVRITNPEWSKTFAEKLAGYKPDLVIGAQGD